MIICIKNLRVSLILGVYEEERHRERDVILNVRLEYDAAKPMESDRIEDALDYHVLRDHIVSVISGTRFKLLEKLAALVLQELIQDPRITAVDLEIDKPNALHLSDSVSAVLHWKRGE